jgi:predicted signal transduction protein with EAL and GGDEF domain
MDIRNHSADILLTVVLVVSSLVLLLRFWQDVTGAVASGLMMLSLGGLFISLQIKMRNLEESVITREHMLRTNLEEISDRMVKRYDQTISHLDELNAEYARRAYK